MSEPNEDVSRTTSIDLTNCDREPIHIPGAIQPYGALLVLNPASMEILQASQSCLAHLGLAPTELVGKSFAIVFGSTAAMDVTRMLAAGVQGAFCRMQLGNTSRDFDGFIHRSEGVAILEIEPASSTETVTVERMSFLMRDTVRRLERAESMIELSQDIADEMRALTRFDRIWVYRFHADWHGEIIAESKRPEIETWLGMHYPASDIPAQARALFLRNWLRVIPDVGCIPSPIEPTDNPVSGQPLDLGGSLLRSVSPIHVQYLTNMGVTASMVISLIHRGKLWGLISGHHYAGPKRLPHAERALCEFLAQVLSLEIGATDRLDDRSYALEIRSRESQLIQRLAGLDASLVVLAADDELLAEMVGASGAMVVHGGEHISVGATPDRDQVAALLAWLRTMSDDSYETSALSTEFPPAAAYADVASGLLAVPLTRDRRDFLLWFRVEQRQTVRWAGDPRKPATIDEDGSARLHPRGSFALWEVEAGGTAVPWRSSEIEAARDLRRAVLDVQIRRSEQVARMYEELLVTNAQLEESAVERERQAVELLEQREQLEGILTSERDARSESDRANRAKADFLAMMSHELRTPLNAIGGYAQLMSLGIRGEVTLEQALDLQRIQVNQRHLLGLINSILNFTKLEAGQMQFKITTVALAPLLLGLDDLIGPQMRAKSLRFSVRECHPDLHVRADSEKLRQILLNLLTNALKFTEREGVVSISCHSEANQVDISVSDTGRGINSERLASAFEPFVQIDRHMTSENEQGVGLGLPISRKLARGMNGELRATSEVGVGSTFTLSIPLAT